MPLSMPTHGRLPQHTPAPYHLSPPFMAILDPPLVAPKNYPPPYPVPPLTLSYCLHDTSTACMQYYFSHISQLTSLCLSSPSTIAIHSTLPAQFSSLLYYLLQLPIPLHQPVKPHTHVFKGFYFFHHPTQIFHLSQLFFHPTTITELAHFCPLYPALSVANSSPDYSSQGLKQEG